MINTENLFGQKIISINQYIENTISGLKPEILEFDDEGYIIDNEQ